MQITPKTPLQIKQLYQAYLKLSEYEQIILKVLALVYRPIGISKFNQLLIDIKHAFIFDIDAGIKVVKPEHRKALIDKGFIHHDQSGLTINPLLLNVLTKECTSENVYLHCIKVIERVLPLRTFDSWNRHKIDEICLARDMYYTGEDMSPLLAFNKNPQVLNTDTGELLIELFILPFDLAEFLTLSDQLQYQSFAAWLMLNSKAGYSHTFLLEQLEQVLDKNPTNKNLTYLCAELYLYALRLDDVTRIISASDTSCYGLQINATLLFFTGEFYQAEQLFTKALTAKNKYAKRKRPFLAGNFGLFYKLCLLVLASDNGAYYDTVFKQLMAEDNDKDTDVMATYLVDVLSRMANSLLSGEKYPVSESLPDYFINEVPSTWHQYVLLELLGRAWCGEKFDKKSTERLQQCEAFFTACTMLVFTLITQQIITRVKALQPKLVFKKEKTTKTNNKNQGLGLVSEAVITSFPDFPVLVSRKAQWDIALEKLIALSPAEKTNEAKPKAASQKASRLIWEMSDNLRNPSFKPREQKQTLKGWTKGRPIALKRLEKEYDSLPYLTPADKEMCSHIEVYYGWDYYQSKEYCIEGQKALIAAKDLDHLYLEGDLDQPITLIQKEPELLLRKQKNQLVLSMSDLPTLVDEHEAFTVKQMSPNNYSFTIFNNAHLKVAEIVGEGGLTIPKTAKDKVIKGVTAIAPLLNIQSDFEELDTGLETIQADNYLNINIQPLGEGLAFTCMIMPFGENGPAFKPLVGNAQLTVELDGKRVATTRDMKKEQQLLDALDTHCPQFQSMSDNMLSVDDPQLALEVLEQLEQLLIQEPMPFLVRLRWPKGKKLKLSKTLSEQHLQLAVGKSSEWFDITGELKINEDQVIELRALLELMSSSNGRFVAMDNGQVLALTHDLKQRLALLNQATDNGKFHALASLQVAEATTGMRLKTIHAWDEQAKKMHESNTITPTVPSTLQAQLRDYQLEGFDWLTRLAHWQSGACLADDMGLGKTLQALTLILSRAEGGPSLVIAPTSVCFNWQQEAIKFAPTLNLVVFSDFSDKASREKLLKSAGAFDCIVISYGLLQRESESLSKVQWHTIIADEAQALKNPMAKRTQAAYALKGDFKVITTGTPIENNLTELWSLFRFITPGLLGNIKRFGERYAFPIENVKEDKAAAKKASLSLKALIQPFILRRMKNQVLTELPARTEINIHVELSDKEQDFYEALRRNAIDNIARASETANEGEQRIRMLAELVKLRQACCNPKLVMPETTLASAKLHALDELLNELQNNNHKALIFSQFVGHLQLIKQHLEKRDIAYQYLDGSTPQKSRKARVNAFQKGEGEVFLISLKAGGSGLNLTAADYVIHMDPWWNPAVEDQASDRAHRMGQKRPVTIYRLIAKNTIEERIVALHQHKRDLADKLLAGNEQSTKLSVDDVLGMLKENF